MPVMILPPGRTAASGGRGWGLISATVPPAPWLSTARMAARMATSMNSSNEMWDAFTVDEPAWDFACSAMVVFSGLRLPFIESGSSERPTRTDADRGVETSFTGRTSTSPRRAMRSLVPALSPSLGERDELIIRRMRVSGARYVVNKKTRCFHGFSGGSVKLKPGTFVQDAEATVKRSGP